MSARFTEQEYAELIARRGIARRKPANPPSLPVPPSGAESPATRPASTAKGSIPRRTPGQSRHDYKADFIRDLELCGLPLPESEVVFALPRKWRFDWLYRKERIAIEYQGGIYYGNMGHQTTKGQERDCEKFSTAASLGYRVLFINAGMVRSGLAVRLVEKSLAYKESSE